MRDIGLQINVQKTKYLIPSRREHVQDSLVFGDFTFEKVSKYLGVDINQQANSHEVIGKLRQEISAILRLYHYLSQNINWNNNFNFT